MWQCPKCKREFLNNNQDHFCRESFETIDEYIESQPKSAQSYLHKVRDTIKNALPDDVQEKISWIMPTYWKNHNLIHFAAFKKHIGLYPGAEAIKFFKDSLREYKSSKGAVQFPYDKPLPLSLIAKIARWCYENNDSH